MEWRGRWTTLLAADVHETRATSPAVQLRHVRPAGRHRRDGVTQRASHVRRTLRGGGGEAKIDRDRDRDRDRGEGRELNERKQSKKKKKKNTRSRDRKPC